MAYGQDMLILGFGDVYQNIDNTDGAVDNIKTFIENGKSVIFSHDTTSNINWDYEEFDSNPVTADGKEIKDSWLWSNNRKDWGYSLNSMFRSPVQNQCSVPTAKRHKTVDRAMLRMEEDNGKSISLK